MNVSITNACNRRCEYCFQKDWYLPKKIKDGCTEMSVDTFDSILKWRGQDIDPAPRVIKILGGEPLMHSNILKILQSCCDNKFDVALISNISIEEQAFNSIFTSPYSNAIISVLANADYPDIQEQCFVQNFITLCERCPNVHLSLSTTILPNIDDAIAAANKLKRLVSIYHSIRNDDDIQIRVSPYAPNPKGSKFKLFDFSLYFCEFFNNLWAEQIIDTHFDCPVNYCELSESAIQAFKQSGIDIKTRKCSPEHGCPTDILVDNSVIWCSSTPHIRLNDWRDFKSYHDMKKALNDQWEEYWAKNKLNCNYTTCDKFGNDMCPGVCCAKNSTLA